MLGVLLEVLLITIGFLFKWPWAFIAGGVIQIWSDIFMVNRPLLPHSRKKLLLINFILYNVGALIGIIFITKAGFKYFPAIMAGVTITGAIAEVIFFIKMIRS